MKGPVHAVNNVISYDEGLTGNGLVCALCAVKDIGSRNNFI